MAQPQSRSKVLSMYKEFPWLRNFASPYQTSSVTVERFGDDEREMLPRVRANRGFAHTKYQLMRCERVFLVDEEGQIVTTPIEQGSPVPNTRFLWFKPETWFRKKQYSLGESIGECLDKLPEDQRVIVRYVLIYYKILSGFNFTIYKIPK